jgi:hypothetical protein
MLKHVDDIRKSARDRAQRRWKNHQVEKEFKKVQQEAADGAAKKTKELEPADVIEQDRIIKEATTKFESKFLKEIRGMLDEHKKRNQLIYLLWAHARRKRLLMEKLRRLEARQAQRDQAAGEVEIEIPQLALSLRPRPKLKSKDLFL